MGRLYGLRQDLVGLHHRAAEILALVVPAMAMPGVKHQADRLLDDVAPAVEILAQSLELIRPIAGADAQPDTAIAEDVDERGALYDPDRVVERQRDDGGANIDTAGLGGEVRHVSEAVGHNPVAGREVVLCNPSCVVAKTLSFEDLVGRARVHVAMRGWLFLGVGM